MFPILIDLGTHELPLFGETHLFLPSYGFLFAVGALAGWWWFLRRARGLGIADDTLYNLSFYTLLAGLLGAKATLVAVDWRTYLVHPGELWGTLRSAGVLAGGVVGGALVFALYAKRHGMPILLLGDAIAAPLALGQAIGRLGCFTAGCCWGSPAAATNPLAVTFTDPAAAAQTGVPLHVPLVATQPIQMINDLALTALLAWMWRRRFGPPGVVFWTYVFVYSVGRGIIEFWRGDAHRGLYFGDLISTSQLFALAGATLAAVMLLRGARRQRAAEA